jgi:hypothetical protein
VISYKAVKRRDEIDRLPKTELVCGSLQAAQGSNRIFNRAMIENKSGKQKANFAFQAGESIEGLSQRSYYEY